ncbi:response regulator [Thermodesulforhabdus norvegica]|uniref:Response regulator receiver domain-containing protein n=1 Tax=Thermodesulforhabdus norvegica TaxID=39841 RepID=A0A1I4SHV2_9BACT|nr:response regulator [Thermodesulforhabdus norvegica]SFM64012.1 Response regulator receiver domain-containing protein [Thermodesulforhabdus norvegica]
MVEDRNNGRILIVDDEVGYTDVLSRRLKKRGFHVECASSGKEALNKLRSGSFDVVVLDLKMEDLNGLEVLRIFRIMEPSMPVIMLTGHGSEEAARAGKELGAFDYLGKPCDFDTLLQVIKKALSHRKGGEA